MRLWFKSSRGRRLRQRCQVPRAKSETPMVWCMVAMAGQPCTRHDDTGANAGPVLATENQQTVEREAEIAIARDTRGIVRSTYVVIKYFAMDGRLKYTCGQLTVCRHQSDTTQSNARHLHSTFPLTRSGRRWGPGATIKRQAGSGCA